MLRTTDWHEGRVEWLGRGWLIAALLGMMLAQPGRTQTVNGMDEALRARITANLKEIESASSRRATDAEVGVLWLHLAGDYQGETDFLRAEEAYTRALKFLNRAGTERQYAIALDGLGTLYLGMGKVKESENCRRRALAIEDWVGDREGAGRLQVSLATVFLQEHKFAESELESTAGLRALLELGEPDKSIVVAGLVTSSFAKCFQGRCGEGLADARDALTLAQTALGEGSLGAITSLMAIGLEKCSAGDETGGGEAMRRAIAILKTSSRIPHGLLVAAQVKVLTEYVSYLKRTHRRDEAKQMEDELAKLRLEERLACSSCTVNVVGLTARQ